MGLENYLSATRLFSTSRNLGVPRFCVSRRQFATSCCFPFRKHFHLLRRSNCCCRIYNSAPKLIFDTDRLAFCVQNADSHDMAIDQRRTFLTINSPKLDAAIVVQTPIQSKNVRLFRKMTYDKEEEEKIIKSITEIKKLVERNLSDVKRIVEKSIQAIKQQASPTTAGGGSEAESSKTKKKSGESRGKPLPDLKFLPLGNQIIVLGEAYPVYMLNKRNTNKIGGNLNYFINIRCMSTNDSDSPIKNHLRNGPSRRIKVNTKIAKQRAEAEEAQRRASEKITKVLGGPKWSQKGTGFEYLTEDDKESQDGIDTKNPCRKFTTLSSANESWDSITTASSSIKSVDTTEQQPTYETEINTFVQIPEIDNICRNPIRPASEVGIRNENRMKQISSITSELNSNSGSSHSYQNEKKNIQESLRTNIQKDLLQIPSKDAAERIRTAKILRGKNKPKDKINILKESHKHEKQEEPISPKAQEQMINEMKEKKVPTFAEFQKEKIKTKLKEKLHAAFPSQAESSIAAAEIPKIGQVDTEALSPKSSEAAGEAAPKVDTTAAPKSANTEVPKADAADPKPAAADKSSGFIQKRMGKSFAEAFEAKAAAFLREALTKPAEKKVENIEEMPSTSKSGTEGKAAATKDSSDATQNENVNKSSKKDSFDYFEVSESMAATNEIIQTLSKGTVALKDLSRMGLLNIMDYLRRRRIQRDQENVLYRNVFHSPVEKNKHNNIIQILVTLGVLTYLILLPSHLNEPVANSEELDENNYGSDN